MADDPFDARASRPDELTAPPPAGASDERPTSVRINACYFSPIIGTQREYEDFFKSEKCDTYTEITVRPKEGILRFATRAERDLFCEHFANSMFKGQKLHVDRGRSLPTNVRTVHLSGFPPGSLTERMIYDYVLRFGFIRRVALKRDFAFVDFDTVEEATALVRQGRFLEIAGQSVRVVFARSEHKMETRLTIPLKQLVPPDHPFWYQLQHMLYEESMDL